MPVNDFDRGHRLASAFDRCQARAAAHADAGLFANHGLEDRFGHRRLVVVAAIAEAYVARVGAVAVDVRGKDALGELAEEPADKRAMLDVALAQSAGRHTADVAVVFDE